MMYQDVQYQHITDHKYFTFTGKETLDGLYDIMTKQFKAPKKTELKFELDNNTITIITKKMLGKPYLLASIFCVFLQAFQFLIAADLLCRYILVEICWSCIVDHLS